MVVVIVAVAVGKLSWLSWPSSCWEESSGPDEVTARVASVAAMKLELGLLGCLIRKVCISQVEFGRKDDFV